MSTKKYTRSIRLTEDVHERLTALCAHLGVTANAYITGEIGKAVSRDEIAFKAQENQTAMFAALSEFMDSQKD
jgi:predicted DNA-binding protein